MTKENLIKEIAEIPELVEAQITENELDYFLHIFNSHRGNYFDKKEHRVGWLLETISQMRAKSPCDICSFAPNCHNAKLSHDN